MLCTIVSSHSVGALEDIVALKASWPKTIWEELQCGSRRGPLSGNHMSNAEGSEGKLCGSLEDLGKIISWYLC